MKRKGIARAADWVVAKLLFGTVRLIGLLPIDTALDTAHRMGCLIGPLTPRHRVVLDNLRTAFPEWDDRRRRGVGREMWGHQARLVVESALLDRLFDYRPGLTTGRIEFADATSVVERYDGSDPLLLFTAHTGSFELMPMMAKVQGVPLASLFRRPNNRFVAERLQTQREKGGGKLVRARKGAAMELAAELRARRAAAVLVDQKFRPGTLIEFFGRPALTNPLIARLAALTKGTVYPARCIRLPDNRYRIEIEEPLVLPRDERNRIDVDKSLRLVNERVERWVREHPEQWMWFHRRWGNSM